MDDTDETEEEVDGSKAKRQSVSPGFLHMMEKGRRIQVVLGLDDQAPPGPDQTSARQGKVLREGELFGRAGKVGDAGEHESPLPVLVSICYLVNL